MKKCLKNMQHLYSDSTSSIYLSDLCYVSTIKHLFISLKNLVVLVDHFIVQEHGVFVLKYSIRVIGFPAIVVRLSYLYGEVIKLKIN